MSPVICLEQPLSKYHLLFGFIAARHFCIDNQGRILGTQATLGPLRSDNLFFLIRFSLNTTFQLKLADLRKVSMALFNVGLKVWAMSLNAFLKLFEIVACGLVVEIIVLTCL